MGAVKGTGRGLCCVGGRYRRTIGKFINGEGKVAPKKFLLGTDQRAAQLANLRLEQLWADVVRATADDNEDRLRSHRVWEQQVAEAGGSRRRRAAQARPARADGGVPGVDAGQLGAEPGAGDD